MRRSRRVALSCQGVWVSQSVLIVQPAEPQLAAAAIGRSNSGSARPVCQVEFIRHVTQGFQFVHDNKLSTPGSATYRRMSCACIHPPFLGMPQTARARRRAACTKECTTGWRLVRLFFVVFSACVAVF